MAPVTVAPGMICMDNAARLGATFGLYGYIAAAPAQAVVHAAGAPANKTINVTGVSGSPEAIAQRIATAVQRPARTVLDEIKRARAFEARVSYV